MPVHKLGFCLKSVFDYRWFLRGFFFPDSFLGLLWALFVAILSFYFLFFIRFTRKDGIPRGHLLLDTYTYIIHTTSRPALCVRNPSEDYPPKKNTRKALQVWKGRQSPVVEEKRKRIFILFVILY